MRQNYDSPGSARQALSTERAEGEVPLLDLLIAVAEHKKLILLLPIVAAFLAALISLVLPNVYTATARIVPPMQQQQAGSALLGQLTSLAGLSGGGLGLKNPSDLYAGMLASRTIADRLIETLGLKEVYDEDTLVETRKALEDRTRIRVGKDSIIEVSVDDEDPKRAAAIANGYVDELDKLNQTLALTEAAQRRLFFERRLKDARHGLEKSENELRQTQETSGVIQLDEQAKAIIGAIANLYAQVTTKEAEIAGIKTFATPRHPEYLRAQEQLSGLRKELVGLQRKHATNLGGNAILPTGSLPEAGLEYVRKFRNVKYDEAVMELLAKQFELAKLDEARDGALIQVVDRAVEPDKKSKPRHALITILAGIAAFLLGVLLALILAAKSRMSRDPVAAARLEKLRAQLRFR